jgi:hypothetical protein
LLQETRIKALSNNHLTTIVEMLEVEEISEEIIKITWVEPEALTMMINRKVKIIKKRMNFMEITFRSTEMILNKIIKTHQTKSLRQLSADILICMDHVTMVINAHMHMEIMISELETKLISMPASHNSSNYHKGTQISKFINICSHRCLFHRLKIYLINKQYIIRKW